MAVVNEAVIRYLCFRQHCSDHHRFQPASNESSLALCI